MCGTHIVQYFSYFCLELYNILNVYIISVCVLFIKFQQKDTFLTITVRINVPCMTNLLFHNKIPKKHKACILGRYSEPVYWVSENFPFDNFAISIWDLLLGQSQEALITKTITGLSVSARNSERSPHKIYIVRFSVKFTTVSRSGTICLTFSLLGSIAMLSYCPN